jgi:hypothetical protein
MSRQMSRVAAIVRRWLGRGAKDRALDAELESFVEHEIDARVESGMTPEQARRTALAAVGGLQQVRELAREARAGAWTEALVRDVRSAVRTAGRSPVLSFAIVGSLAAGITVTIVAYAFVNASMFKAYPGVSQQGRMFELDLRRSVSGRPHGHSMGSAEDYQALRTGLAAVAMLVASLIPAMRASRVDPVASLKDG